MNTQDELTTLTALEAALEIAESLLLNLAILTGDETVADRKRIWEHLQHLKEYAAFERSQLNAEAKP